MSILSYNRPMPPLRPAVFLDRDGVIIENRADYVKSLAETKLIPGVLEALAQLARADWLIVVVTNQAAIGRHIITRETVDGINDYVIQAIGAAGGRVDRLYLCPHHPDDRCTCRKPAPGLLLQAAAELGIDLENSVMIGDAASDVQAALTAKVKPIFLLSGLAERLEQELALARQLNATIYPDLAAAVKALLEEAAETAAGACPSSISSDGRFSAGGCLRQQ
jgi:D-glycero-D-manno-heptose 1,7-bisphosphate phosphatase